MGTVTLEQIAEALGRGDRGGPRGRRATGELEHDAAQWRLRVGGKAVGLALLIGCGLPVPAAAVIEARHYRQALRADPSFERFPGEVEEAILGAMSTVRRTGAGVLVVRSSATIEDTAERSFAGQGYTALGVRTREDLFSAVRSCYRSLRAPRATTYIQALESAAKGSPRTGTAAARRSPKLPGMAVIVQAQVFPSVSGVLFTVDPRSGEPAVVVNATYGSGESVAGGLASADVYAVVQVPGGLRSGGRRPGLKKTEVVYDRHGRRLERPVGRARRESFCLSERELLTLAAAGIRTAEQLGGPQDMEWALVRGGPVWFLQTRPVTASGGRADAGEALMSHSGGLPDPWGYNDTLIGDHLWTNVNVGEGLPGVLTPFAWSVAHVFFDRAARNVFGVFAEGAPVFGNVYGRMYLNLTGRASVARSLAWVIPRGVFEQLLTRGWEEIWGSTPEDVGLPLIPVSTLRTYLRLPRTVALFLKASWRYHRGFRRFLKASRDEVRRIRRELAVSRGNPLDLAEIWQQKIEPRLLQAGTMVMFTAAAAAASQKQLSLSWPLLRYRVPGALSRIVAGVEGLASVEPSMELWKLSRLVSGHPELTEMLAETAGRPMNTCWRAALARSERGERFILAFDVFMEHHGHRSDVEFEYSEPSWAEDPRPVLAAIVLQADLPESAGPIAAQQERVAEAQRELDGIRRRLGLRATRLVRGLVAMHHANMRRREEARDLLVLWASLSRDFVRAAGNALQEADILPRAGYAVFLELPELLAAMRETGRASPGESSATSPAPAAPGGAPAGRMARRAVQAREERYSFYRRLPDPPAVIRGPLRGGHLSSGERRGHGPLGIDRLGRTVVRGLPASPGRTTGLVRVLASPRDAARLKVGEVLVSRTANVGWTILFPSVAAVVTDVGAPFSHAAIVTRELARPAVVDTKLGTAVLCEGDLVRVDGDRGEVTRLVRRRRRRGKVGGPGTRRRRPGRSGDVPSRNAGA